MKGCLIILLLVLANLSYSQRVVSIDSLSGFTCFDTISEFNVWRVKNTYFPDSTMKEEVRFRVWGVGCIQNPEMQKPDKKCFYKFQRQTYFGINQIEEKEEISGWYVGSESESIYHQYFYNKKGKLLYVQKVKQK